MKVTQEKLPASRIGLKIEIPGEMSQQVYNKVVKDLSRSVKIPGFRPGKVPPQIMLQRLGTERIKLAALEDLIQDGFREALKQEEIDAIGNYQVLSSLEDLAKDFQPGEPFTFSASVDVPPEVQVTDYKGWNVKAEETVFETSEVDKFLAERQKEKATLIPVEGRAAQEGDVAVVDYNARFAEAEGEEGEPEEIPGLKATDAEIELEPEQFLREMVEGIIGMSAGETKDVSIAFDEDYPREDLAGKNTVFTITLKDIKEKELPTLDDDFAQEVSEFETLSELQESLTSRFRERAEKATTESINDALAKELLNHVEIDLPETSIEREVETMLRQTVAQLSSYGMDVKKMLNEEMVSQLREKSRPEAIDRLKQSLGLEEIAKRESLEVDPEALAAEVEKWKKELSGQSIDENRLQEVVKSDLLKEKTLKWLQEQSAVELVPLGSLSKEEETEEAEPEPQVEAKQAEEAEEEQAKPEPQVEAKRAKSKTAVENTPAEAEAEAAPPSPQEDEPPTEEEAKPKTRRKTKK
ncbi:MAG: trigger factor [Cyanosarcina radialis HA8281-LM2]|jgi:trigger factor|nr:trigger factor [Cyanosarcina radialis HA8281-LM2]